MKAEWGKTMERYVASPRKKLVFVLLDIRRIPSQEDMDMLIWLDHHNIPFKNYIYKMDKVSNNEKFKCMKDIKKKIEFHNDDVLFHSSLNDTGREDILNYIESLLNKEESIEEE